MHKVSQYADDLFLVLRDSTSLEKALNVIDEFAIYSGLQVNPSKSQGLRVNSASTLGTKGSQFAWNDKISILGFDFDSHQGR